MKKIITQDNQNDKQISKSIKRFFVRFHISTALKAANAYKKKGVPVIEIFQYLFLLVFSNSLVKNAFTEDKDYVKTPIYNKAFRYRQGIPSKNFTVQNQPGPDC